MTDRLIIGCGYLGLRVAKQWITEGHRVFALTRTEKNAATLAQAGIQPILGDVMSPETLPMLPVVEQVLYAVGFDRQSGHSIEEVYVRGLKNIVANLPKTINQFLYISSTGVYGQADGSWLTEQSETNPTRPGGKACLKAEQFLLEVSLPKQTTVLRLAGIYGPNRVPRLDQIKSGKPLAIPQDGWLNLIHVEDAVTIINIMVQQTPKKACYLVSDGCPVLRKDYLGEIAGILGAPPVTFTAVDPHSAVGQRARNTKRISNEQLESEFDIAWKYPTFREGLQGILKNL
ncbi:MAG: SDR family oxidoreductase [Pirellulales bacterium]|nr:NAD(P)-dependent oxidoreductase [Rhodopirellula sp.]MCH2369444.1 SDR family oxidoreductase [Pirellulales bacterium]|tara:strand:+ start:3032 stop:3895 length:864 start_codon:yes stop_codon:yes gene_type:complete